MNWDNFKNKVNYINNWAEYFGEKNIIVQPYEKEQFDEGLIKHLLTHLNISDYHHSFNIEEKIINNSFGRVALEILFIINKLFLPVSSTPYLNKNYPIYESKNIIVRRKLSCYIGKNCRKA